LSANLSGLKDLTGFKNICMKQYEIPLESDKIHHIYNRGIDRANLFYEARNYSYFLEKYAKYMTTGLDTFAYCLLKNHFHLLVRVKDFSNLSNLEDSLTLEQKGLHSPDRIVSKMFADMFNSYSKSINKAQDRTGKLFETPFKRILVEDDVYFTRLIWYIHFNPQKHGFVKDFREYPYSSYHSHLSNKPTKLARDLLLWRRMQNFYDNQTIGFFGGIRLVTN
jgi:putative transposase